MGKEAFKRIEEDEKKLQKAENSNMEKIDQIKTKLTKCKVLFDGFTVDIRTSMKYLSNTEIIKNRDNVKKSFKELNKILLNEVKDLDLVVSTPRFVVSARIPRISIQCYTNQGYCY